MIPHEVGSWFKQRRESYSWPDGSTRHQSERIINLLADQIRDALDSGDAVSLQQLLIDIHSWKNNNRMGLTNRYRGVLEAQGHAYIENLLNMSTFNNSDRLENVVNHLKIRECNLPTCTAIASFLYGRTHVPVIDKFMAQFFARRFNRYDLDANTSSALQWIGNIDFRIEEDGSGRLRLAVFSRLGFEANLKLYIQQLVPECERISEALSTAGFMYNSADGVEREFAPVDVEMAIFSWATKNRHLFD